MGDYTREGGKRLLQFFVPLQLPDRIDGRPERVAKSGPERETAMNHQWNRRDVLKGLVAASSAALVRPTLSACRDDASTAAQPVEVQITPVSPHTVRLSILPVANNGSVGSIPFDGSLVQESWGTPIAKLRAEPGHTIVVGSIRIEISLRPVRVTATNERGDVIQQFRLGRQHRCSLFFSLETHRYLVWGRVDPSSTAAAPSTSCAAGRAATSLLLTVAEFPFPGSSGRPGGRYFFTSPTGLLT